MGKFLLGLIGLFFVEIWVLIKVGSSIGALTTLILMVLAAMLGGQLVRSQGVMTLFNLQKRMQAGEAPGGELLQGIWLAVAGFLFIFPGFVSDIFGLLLLQPAIRRGLTRLWIARMASTVGRASVHAATFRSTDKSRKRRDRSSLTVNISASGAAMVSSSVRTGAISERELDSATSFNP